MIRESIFFIHERMKRTKKWQKLIFAFLFVAVMVIAGYGSAQVYALNSTLHSGMSGINTTCVRGGKCKTWPIEPGYVFVQPYTLLDIEKTAGKPDEDDEYTYIQQWASFHQQVCLQNPEQDKNAIIFVPKRTWDPVSDDALNKKAKYSYLWDKAYEMIETKGTNGEFDLHRMKNSKWGENVIFSEDSREDNPTVPNPRSEPDKIIDICYNGIFYDALEKLCKGSDGKFDISRLEKEIGTTDGFEKFIKKHISDTKIKNSKLVWEWITNIDDTSTGNGVYTCAGTRVTDFVACGYNATIIKVKYKDEDCYLPGLGFDVEAHTMEELDEWVIPNAEMKEVFQTGGNPAVRTRAMNEYNLHQLDLMMAAYACIYDRNCTAKAGWEKAIAGYAKTAGDPGKVPKTAIYIGIGSISVGTYSSNDKSVCVFGSSNDYVNSAYGLYNAGLDTKNKNVNKKSSSKAFNGYQKIQDGTAGKLENKYNKEYDSTKKFPSFYSSYYSRLGYAIAEAHPNSNFSATSSSSFAGTAMLHRILRGLYHTQKGKKPAVHDSNRNALNNIELMKQSRFDSIYTNTYATLEQMYGGGFIPLFAFRQYTIIPPDGKINVLLDIKSSLNEMDEYQEATSSKKNNTIGTKVCSDEYINDTLGLQLRIKYRDENDKGKPTKKIKAQSIKKWKQVFPDAKDDFKVKVVYKKAPDLVQGKGAKKKTFKCEEKIKSSMYGSSIDKTIPYLKAKKTTAKTLKSFLSLKKSVHQPTDAAFAEQGLDISDGKTHVVGYYADVTITYTSKIDGKKKTVKARSNKVYIKYKKQNFV